MSQAEDPYGPATSECPVCGHRLDGYLCQFACPNCGYREDCSDAFTSGPMEAPKEGHEPGRRRSRSGDQMTGEQVTGDR